MWIRNFSPSDVKRVYEIEAMSFNQPYGINMFLKFQDIGAGFLVALKKEYVIGYIIFLPKSEIEGHIVSIAVDKNYRRLNVASKLLSKAITTLIGLNIKKITLEVNENNTGAIKFYKTFNFKVDRVVPHYYNNEDGALIMTLELDSLKVLD